MSPGARRLLEALADGRLHSGTVLAAAQGVTRAAVGKQVARLRAAGWPVEAARGVGYRLTAPVAPLEAAAIEAELAAHAGRIHRLEVCATVDSTSTRLEAQPAPPPGRVALCIAESQTAGRGRRDRPWRSAPGRSITFSLARRFDRPPPQLGALAPAAAVAVAEALAGLGVRDVGLKWPNDLVRGDAKLGGILVDMRGEIAGAARATVGVGLNYAGLDGPAPGQPVAHLLAAKPDLAPRDRVAGRLMAALVEALDRFERDGLEGFRAGWKRRDVLADRPVSVWRDGERSDGIARGIAADGGLELDGPDRRRRVYSGDVSVRRRA